MNGDANITINTKKDVLTIPTICLIQRDEDIFVKIKAKDGKIEERTVQLGLETDEKTEIIKGLTVDDEVVLPQQNY